MMVRELSHVWAERELNSLSRRMTNVAVNKFVQDCSMGSEGWGQQTNQCLYL